MKIQKIDLKDPSAPFLFAKSLRETGFAVISNHAIPEGILKDSYIDWQEFFSDPRKTQYAFNPTTQAGYFPFKSENAKGYPAKDLKEFYHLYDSKELPSILATTATVILRERLIGMAATLLGWLQNETPIEVKSGLRESFPQMIEGSKQTLFRILHYPPLRENEESGAVRAAAHEDINLLTLLPAATAPGLQVRDLQGVWHDVPCDPGDIVVNAGDMLQLATDGYYKSTTHQVVNPTNEQNRSRYSMPLFLHPRPEVYLGGGLTAGAYLNQRLRELGLIK